MQAQKADLDALEALYLEEEDVSDHFSVYVIFLIDLADATLHWSSGGSTCVMP